MSHSREDKMLQHCMIPKCTVKIEGRRWVSEIEKVAEHPSKQPSETHSQQLLQISSCYLSWDACYAGLFTNCIKCEIYTPSAIRTSDCQPEKYIQMAQVSLIISPLIIFAQSSKLTIQLREYEKIDTLLFLGRHLVLCGE